MKTKKLKKLLKNNYSKEFVLNAYEFFADPTSYFLEHLQSQDYDYILDYILDVFLEENVSILDAINYYIKNQKI